MTDTFDLPITQRRVAAGEAPMSKPLGAASSVFDIARQAKPKRSTAAPFDGKVEIRKGVPLPPVVSGRAKADVYGGILRSMQDGDMVELTAGQASTLVKRARALSIEVAVRNLGNGKRGIWRVGLLASTEPKA